MDTQQIIKYIIGQKRFYLITLLLLVSNFVLLFKRIRPLILYDNKGFLEQIPVSFWITIILIITTLLILNFFSDEFHVSIFSTCLLYMVLFSYQFLFTGLFGGDIVSERQNIIRQNAYLTPEIHFNYLQFPAHWISQRIFYLVVWNEASIISGIEFGFLIYIFLFALAVWTFIYSFSDSYYIPFVGSAVFASIASHFWNFQFVPQYLALIILAFLIGITNKTGWNWLLIKVALFITLVNSHPMFFIFYLIPVLIYPIIKGISEANDVESNGKISFGSSILQIASSLSTFFPQSMRNIYDNLTEFREITYALSLVIIYAFIFLYKQVIWQQSLFAISTKSVRAGSAEYIDKFVPFIDTSYRASSNVDAIGPRRLLYLSTSEQVSTMITYWTISLIFAGSMFVIVLYLVQDKRKISPFQISVLLISAIYFVLGFSLNILGSRAIQVAYLPLVLGITAIEDAEDTKKLVMLGIVTIIILSSPILVLNSLSNAENTGGGKTGDFYTEQAGQWLDSNDWEYVINPRQTLYPIDKDGTKTKTQIRFLAFHYSENENVPKQTYVLYDGRMINKISHRVHKCNFHEQNRIYNNNNEHYVMYTNEKLTCHPDTSRISS